MIEFGLIEISQHPSPHSQICTSGAWGSSASHHCYFQFLFLLILEEYRHKWFTLREQKVIVFEKCFLGAFVICNLLFCTLYVLCFVLKNMENQGCARQINRQIERNKHNHVVSFIWKQVTHDNQYMYINFIYHYNREGKQRFGIFQRILSTILSSYKL